MAINLKQGLLTAVSLPRNLSSSQVFAAAGLSAAMPGPLGMLVALLLVKNSNTVPVPAPLEELLEVPDVVGSTEKDALAALEGMPLNVEVKAATVQGGVPGHVILQKPEGKKMVLKGSTVTLSVQPAVHCQVAND